MSGNKNQFDWLYPDLMPKDDLISILKQRYIKTESLEVLDKDELVDLYNKHILPLPQRKYRNNRRGQQMTKKQVIAAKKRRIDSSEDNPVDQPKHKRRSTGNLVTSFELPTTSLGDRLKPPPSCINFEKKRIKLKNDSKSSNDAVSSSLDKLKINKIDCEKEDSISSKKIKLNNRKNKPDEASGAGTEGKKTKLNESTKNEDCPVNEKKKKIAKISWP